MPVLLTQRAPLLNRWRILTILHHTQSINHYIVINSRTRSLTEAYSYRYDDHKDREERDRSYNNTDKPADRLRLLLPLPIPSWERSLTIIIIIDTAPHNVPRDTLHRDETRMQHLGRRVRDGQLTAHVSSCGCCGLSNVRGMKFVRTA